MKELNAHAVPEAKKIAAKVGGVSAKVITYFVLILFTIMIVFPIMWAVLSSFKDKADFANNSVWSLPSSLYFENFVNAWFGANMGGYFINTIIITALSLAILLVLSVPSAYILTRYKFFGRKFLLLLILAGIFINVNFIVVPLFSMMISFGDLLGLPNFATNIFMVSLINASTSLAFSVYLMTGFFISLSPSFEEAAKLDGCGYFTMLIKIIVPLAMPSILIVILFNFLKFWNEYLVAQTFLIDVENWTISIGLLNLMEVDKTASDKGRMFAGLTIVMIPTLVFYALVQKQLTSGITVGGVKG